MTDDEDDIERWAARLAGKEAPESADLDVEPLRSVIQASDRSVSDIAAADRAAQARLLKRLESEGLLTDGPRVVKSKLRWQPWVGAAAAALMVAVILQLTQLPEVARGVAGEITVVSATPAATLEQVMSELKSMDLQPRKIREDGGVSIEVEVPQERLEVFHAWFLERGGRAVSVGAYRIVFDTQ